MPPLHKRKTLADPIVLSVSSSACVVLRFVWCRDKSRRTYSCDRNDLHLSWRWQVSVVADAAWPTGDSSFQQRLVVLACVISRWPEHGKSVYACLSTPQSSRVLLCSTSCQPICATGRMASYSRSMAAKGSYECMDNSTSPWVGPASFHCLQVILQHQETGKHALHAYCSCKCVYEHSCCHNAHCYTHPVAVINSATCMSGPAQQPERAQSICEKLGSCGGRPACTCKLSSQQAPSLRGS